MSNNAEASEFTAHFKAGHVAYQQGDHAQALSSFESALALQAGDVPTWLMKARCLVILGQAMAAREAFAQTLRLDPKNYSAWLEAGHLCRQMGEADQAKQAYARAVDVDAQRFEAHVGMARLATQQGDHGLAHQAYAAAVQTAQAKGLERVRQVHWLMGQYWLEVGHAREALPCLSEALKATQSDQPEQLVNLAAEIQIDVGKAWLLLGERDKAMRLLSLASAATQEGTLARLMELSYRHNFWQEAIEVARRCLSLFPKSAAANWNLAHLLVDCWQMEEAEMVLEQAEALGPMPGATSLRAAAAGKSGDADTALKLYLGLAQANPMDFTYASSAAMSSLYSDQQTPEQVADLHRSLFAALGQGARDRDTFVRERLKGRRLRLGVISADFHHQHPVNIFLQPVLRELDKSKFEVFMYFVGDSHDEQTRLAQSRVEHWVEATKFQTRQLSKRIDADQIDVLLDLAGHTNQHRMGLFAQRAAPVQITYLGYPGSTGVPNMDYLLGDEVVSPKGSDHLFTEQVLRLPGTVFCFAPEEDYPYPVFDAATAKRPLTFGSFNTLPKLTPRTLSLWARVLKAVPKSRLLIKAPSFTDEAAKRMVGQRLEALGVDLSRVEFRGPVGLTDMMAEYADVDIALDTVPYNGGTTSLQALWMGAPLVTQRGGSYVSRMGASFMTAAGLPEWVAEDDDGYVAIAKAMAKDRKALLSLKQGLRQRLQNNPAWDVVAHTRAMESAIQLAASTHLKV
jgi:predicted O-linked N-acetylglucosamine transferase (SPINDLY family)